MADSEKQAEFAFDLFSDIAPILALFGDEFARQFASESLTWVDHLIIAMVPLGILTIITGAIRVQGPRIAKSFIGRGRENRALAEIELMSSTSKEVCELFNGKSIIRVMGKPNLAQILVFPGEYTELMKKYEEEDRATLTAKGSVVPTKDRSCGINSLKTAVSSKNRGYPLMRCVDYHSYGYMIISKAAGWILRCFGPHSKRSSDRDRKQVDLDFDRLGPPNLQLGLSSDQYEKCTISKRHEIFLAAVAAVILQAGLVAIATVTVYHGRIRNAIPFDAEAYGYPCYVIGTIFLCVGVSVCARAVERNTTEFDWQVLSPNDRAPTVGDTGVRKPEHATPLEYVPPEDSCPRVFWLQKSQEVSDQAFGGYAILGGPKYHIITSSRLEDAGPQLSWSPIVVEYVDKASSDEASRFKSKNPQDDTTWKLLTVCAVTAAGFGFVAQFMGLRGLTYPCSIAQLVAILLMALIRALVRRRLGRSPVYCPVLARYEMDFLATAFVYSEGFRDYSTNLETKPPILAQENTDFLLRWKVKTAKDMIKHPFRFTKLEDVVAKHTARTLPVPNEDAPTPSDKLSSEKDPSCRQLIRVRKRLAELCDDLCDWQSLALESALSLATSIEAFMNAFFPEVVSEKTAIRPGKRIDYLDWTVETVGLASAEQLGERADFILIPVRRNKSDGTWQADVSTLEAALSLWLATIEAQPKATEEGAATWDRKQAPALPDLGFPSLRRTKAANDLRYKFCRILGDDFDNTNAVLKRDLSWWVDELIAEQSDDCEDSMQNTNEFIANESEDTISWCRSKARKEVDLIIGFNGHKNHFQTRLKAIKSPARELAISDVGRLPTILAQHLFTSFVWTAVEHLAVDCLRQGFVNSEQDVEIEGRHTFDPLEFRETWRRPTLRHRGLTKLVREIEKDGLGTQTDILLCIIPALSSRDLLPNHVILKLIPPINIDQGWSTTARSFHTLLGTSLQTLPSQNPEMFCYSVVIAAMDFLYLACEPYDDHVKPQEELQGELQELIKQLTSERFKHILTRLIPLYRIQNRWQRFEQMFAWFPSVTDLSKSVGSNVGTQPDDPEESFNQSSVFKDEQEMEFFVSKLGFSKFFKDLYVLLDFEASNPSSYVPFGLTKNMQKPLRFTTQVVKEVKSPDIFGWSPLHYAALARDYECLAWIFRDLSETKHIRVHHVYDKIKRTPIHVAVAASNQTVWDWLQRCLGDDAKSACNAFGLDQATPLHLATRTGSLDYVRIILSLSQGSRQTLTKPDFWGREAIHLAASFGHVEIAKELLSEGAQPYSIDEIGKSPLDYLLKGDADLRDDRPCVGQAAASDTPDVENTQIDAKANDVDEEHSPTAEESSRQEQGDQKRKIFIAFALKKLDYHDRTGQTFFHHAVQYTDSQTVLSLVESGYNLNHLDLQGRSSLHLAILAGRTEMALLLLRGITSRGQIFIADPAAEDKQKETALMFAAREGQLDIVKRLIWEEYSENPAVDLPTSRHEDSSFSTSARKSGCDPLSRNLGGMTALHLAVAYEQDAVAQYLLKIHPLQPNSRDNSGESLLVTACKRASSVDCIRGIVDQWPTDLNYCDKVYDQTPLSWACERKHKEIVKALLSYKDIDLNKQASEWRNYTALHFAADEDNSDIVQMLLDDDRIELDVKDRDRHTPLEVAIREREPDVIRTFLSHAKIDVQTRLTYIKEFSVHAYENMHGIIPGILKSMGGRGMTDNDLLKCVKLSEDLRDTRPYEAFARYALWRESTRHKIHPGPMHAAARLNDLLLMNALCKSAGIESCSIDKDGWTCIEYANTYRSEPVGTEFEQLAATRIPKQVLDTRRTHPVSLDCTKLNHASQPRGCAVAGHKDCPGLHVIQVKIKTEDDGDAKPMSERVLIRTTKCAPPLTTERKNFYFEVTVLKETENNIFGIGFCDAGYSLEEMPGWYDISFGYHGDDGLLYINEGGLGQGPTPEFGLRGRYSAGDTVGIGLNLETGEGFVTFNGKRRDVGGAFESTKFKGRKMYPCIGFDGTEHGDGLHFELNLGACRDTHPFMYKDLDKSTTGVASSGARPQLQGAPAGPLESVNA